MIPSETATVALAQATEAALNKQGWDALDPTLFIITRTAVSSGDAYAVEEVPSILGSRPEPPGVTLQRMARKAHHLPQVAESVPAMALGSLAGLMVAAEAWVNDSVPDRERGRHLADIPGSQEARYVIALDCAGRIVVVSRVRGQGPELIVQPPHGIVPGALAQWAGSLLEGLRDLLLASGSIMPAGSIDLDAVKVAVRS